MPLNMTADDLNTAGNALAEELGCGFGIIPGPRHDQITLGFNATPECGDFIFNFSLTFDTPYAASPSDVWLAAFNHGAAVQHGFSDAPASFSTFTDMEVVIRGLFAVKDNVAKPKPKKAPAKALTLTYGELSNFLSQRASMSNDMHDMGDSDMIVVAYSNKDDDRSGIDINLKFHVNEDVDTGNQDNPSISLVSAEREANDHEWEDYSSKNLSLRSVDTLNGLLALLEKHSKPKGKKPKK